ncbi:MAG TPA: cytochrome c [Sphingobium sp.]|nr:cytochrome c [Sphingobium sp.]
MSSGFHGGLIAGLVGIGLLFAATGAVSAAGQATGTGDAVARGHGVFVHQCAPCHGAGPGDDGSPRLPGTAALVLKYQGEQPPELEKRTDLNADILRLFVRQGVGAMPMFRKAELSDRDIDDIAAYLKASAASR